jgi:hypothetical protein
MTRELFVSEYSIFASQSPEEMYETKSLIEQVYNELDRLDDRYEQVFLRRALDGETRSSIGKTLPKLDGGKNPTGKIGVGGNRVMWIEREAIMELRGRFWKMGYREMPDYWLAK